MNLLVKKANMGMVKGCVSLSLPHAHWQSFLWFSFWFLSKKAYIGFEDPQQLECWCGKIISVLSIPPVCWALVGNATKTSTDVVDCFSVAQASPSSYLALEVNQSDHPSGKFLTQTPYMWSIHIGEGQHYPWWIIHWKLVLKRKFFLSWPVSISC